MYAAFTVLLNLQWRNCSYNCGATLAYTKSDLPLESSSSSSAHSLLHHSSFALAASLRNSLFSCLYLCLPYSSFLFFHFLLSSILFVISSVIQDFLILSFFS